MNPPKKRCNIGYWEEGRSQFSVNAPYGYKKQMSDSGKKKSGKFAYLIGKDLSMFWMSHFVHGKQTNLLTWSGRQAGDQTSRSTDSASLVKCTNKNELLRIFSW